MTTDAIAGKRDKVVRRNHPGDSRVMVAHQRHIAGFPAQCDRLHRIRPVSDDIPKADNLVRLLDTRVPKHLLERLGIRMDVRKYRVPHIISLLTQEILPVALSRQPVGVVARTAEAVIEVEVI